MGAGLPATVDAPAAGSVPAPSASQIRAVPDPTPRSRSFTLRLAELLRQHYGRVWRALRQIGVDESCADDAAQEVFIILSRKLPDVREGSERSFLLGTAVRVAANYRRAGRVRHEVVDENAVEAERAPEPSAEQLLDQKRMRRALDELLEGFPDEIRTAFVLYELEGLSVPEIAELTDTKQGTVASRLRRARELFQAGVKRLRARSAGDRA
jgi:RNA polymerase sigma-70 factor (ECF subfamily)